MLLNVQRTHSTLNPGEKNTWVPTGLDTMSYSYLRTCPYTGQQTEHTVTYTGKYTDKDNFEWSKQVH